MANPRKPRAKREGSTPLGSGVNEATVNVKFIYENGRGTVSFPDPDGGDVAIASQPAGKSGKITFKLTSDSTSGASLSDISFSTPPPQGLFDHHLHQGDLVVHDHNHLPAGSQTQEYTYSIQVDYNGSPYLGDPKIQNDPSSGPEVK